MTGFTTGESLKVWSWFKDGWDCDAIKSRLNRARSTGYLRAQNLPVVKTEQVKDLLKHVGALK